MKDSELNAKTFVLVLLTFLIAAAAFSEPLGEFIKALAIGINEGRYFRPG